MEPDPYSDEEKEKSAVMHKHKSTARDMLNFGNTSTSNSVGGEGKELLSRSMNAASLKLPQIKFNRKVGFLRCSFCCSYVVLTNLNFYVLNSLPLSFVVFPLVLLGGPLYSPCEQALRG